MHKITKQAYYKIPADYRCVWSRDDEPQYAEWVGRRTFLAMDQKTGGTVLEIEGVSFEITA